MMFRPEDGGRPVAIDPEFRTLARSWMRNPSQLFLTFIWSGYEDMKMTRPVGGWQRSREEYHATSGTTYTRSNDWR